MTIKKLFLLDLSRCSKYLSSGSYGYGSGQGENWIRGFAFRATLVLWCTPVRTLSRAVTPSIASPRLRSTRRRRPAAAQERLCCTCTLQWYNYRKCTHAPVAFTAVCTCYGYVRNAAHLFYRFGEISGNHWLRVIVCRVVFRLLVCLRQLLAPLFAICYLRYMYQSNIYVLYRLCICNKYLSATTIVTFRK